MLTIAGRVTALALTGAAGILGADQVSAGPDLEGIALLITAISGFVATVGALVIALRRKPAPAESDASLALRIAAHAIGLEEEEHPHDPT